MVLVDHGKIHGEDNDKDNRHKCCKGDGPDRGTTVERLGGDDTLRGDSSRFLACG